MYIPKETYKNMTEFWVNVKVRKTDGSFYDLEDYEISNFGNIRKLQGNTYKEIYSRKATSDDNDGYRKINIVAKYSGRILTLRLDETVMASIFPQFYKPVYKVYHVDNDINNCSIYNLYLGRPSEGKKPKECVALPYDLPFEPSDEDILETASNYIDAADFENNFYELFCWANCKDLMRKIKYRQVSVEPDDVDKDDEIESGFEPVVEDRPIDIEDELVENELVTSDTDPDQNNDITDTDPDPDGLDHNLDLLDRTSVEIDSKQNGVKFELKITAHDAESLWKALGDLVMSIRDGQLPGRRSSNIHKDDSGCRYRFDGEKLIVNVVPSTLTDEEMIDIASHYSSRKVFRRQQYTMYTYCVRRGIVSKLKFKDEL